MLIGDSELDLNHSLEGSYLGKPFTGAVVEYYPGGELRSKLPYVDGQQQGPARDWYPGGQLAGESNYRDNHLHGWDREWFEDGQIKLEAYFEFGILISRKQWSPDGELVATFELEETSPYRRFLKEARASHSSADQG